MMRALIASLTHVKDVDTEHNYGFNFFHFLLLLSFNVLTKPTENLFTRVFATHDAVNANVVPARSNNNKPLKPA